VDFKGSRVPAKVALQRLGLKPLRLKAKEGLALINGTQFMSAYAVHCLIRIQLLLATADLAAAMTAGVEFAEALLPLTYESMKRGRILPDQDCSNYEAFANWIGNPAFASRLPRRCRILIRFGAYRRCMELPEIAYAHGQRSSKSKSIPRRIIRSFFVRATFSWGEFSWRTFSPDSGLLAIAWQRCVDLRARLYLMLGGARWVN